MPNSARQQLNKQAVAEVLSIYAELDGRPVSRNCERRNECCQFKLTGLTPYLTKGEALTVARAWRASGRKTLPEQPGGICPVFDSMRGKCSIYAERPFACRTHFCAAAGGPIARREIVDLIRRLEMLDATLGGTGAQRLPVAVKAALQELT